MPPGELPTLGEILDQYHTATFRDALELSEHTGLPPDECVQYALPFQARIACATLDILAFAESERSMEEGRGVIPLSITE